MELMVDSGSFFGFEGKFFKKFFIVKEFCFYLISELFLRFVNNDLDVGYFYKYIVIMNLFLKY